MPAVAIQKAICYELLLVQEKRETEKYDLGFSIASDVFDVFTGYVLFSLQDKTNTDLSSKAQNFLCFCFLEEVKLIFRKKMCFN